MRRVIAGVLSLVAVAAAPLPLPVGQTWVADAIEGRPVMAAAAPTVRFADGQITGQATCHAYTGPYRLVKGQLDIGPLVNAKSACPAPQAEQEARFLSALEGARTFAVQADGTLVLTGPAGRLTLRAGAAR